MQATELKFAPKSALAEKITEANAPNLIAEYIELVERIFAQSQPKKKKAARAIAGPHRAQLIA